MESHYFDTEYGKIHYTTKGENDHNLPVIMFLHGGNPSSQHTEFWKPILSIINQYCNPVLVDRFGHGKSKSDHNLTLTEHLSTNINLINYIINKYNLNDIGLIGRSAGGYLALEIAKQIGEINGLGLIAPARLSAFEEFLKTWTKKPIVILWDIQDPVVRFPSINDIDTLESYNFFTIGKPSIKTLKSIERNDIQASHIPELKAPKLFEEFLQTYCNALNS